MNEQMNRIAEELTEVGEKFTETVENLAGSTEAMTTLGMLLAQVTCVRHPDDPKIGGVCGLCPITPTGNREDS